MGTAGGLEAVQAWHARPWAAAPTARGGWARAGQLQSPRVGHTGTPHLPLLRSVRGPLWVLQSQALFEQQQLPAWLSLFMLLSG